MLTKPAVLTVLVLGVTLGGLMALAQEQPAAGREDWSKVLPPDAKGDAVPSPGPSEASMGLRESIATSWASRSVVAIIFATILLAYIVLLNNGV